MSSTEERVRVFVCVCKVNFYKAEDKPAGFEKKEGQRLYMQTLCGLLSCVAKTTRARGEVLLNEWRSGEPATASPVELQIH